MKRIIILLLLCGFARADVTCIVGGSSSAATNAGWFDPDQVTLADFHGANGAALASGTGACTNIAGDVLITDTDAFGDVEVGMYVYCDFIDNQHTDGRYEIDGLNSDDSITLDLEYVADEAVDWVLGGAVPNTYNAVAYDLEDVLDDSIGDAAAQQVQILIYNASAVDPTEKIMVDDKGGSGAFWKRIIGADSAYAPLTVGNYAEYDCGVTGLAATTSLLEITVNNIRIENLAMINPDGSGGTPAAGESCFENTSGNNVVFENCYAERGYYGFDLVAGGDRCAAINCIATDVVTSSILMGSNDGLILGGVYSAGTAFSPVRMIDVTGDGCTLQNICILNGTRGVNFIEAAGLKISNCNFINQTIYGLNVNNANAVAYVTNCIFDVFDPAADYAIYRLAGSVYELNNITDADTVALSGFNSWSGSSYNLTFTNTDPWVSISGGDYRINWGQSIANTYVIDKGLVPYHGSGTATINKSNLGAWNYQQAKGHGVRR